MKKIGNKVWRIFLVLFFIAGASVVLYPVISNAINQKNQTVVISNYEKELKKLSEEEKEKKLQAARKYNQQLSDSNLTIQDPFSGETTQNNQSFLNIGEILAYIEIPQIDVFLPIYDGMSEAILQVGVGWMEGTSMPVGGESSHCVLTGHRGLPEAKLFRDLDKLKKGDVFWVKSLDEKLYYEVYSTEVIKPMDIDKLHIEPGWDLMTLLTCHPYMINNERLLVHARRVDEPSSAELDRISTESGAMNQDKLLVGVIVGGGLLLLLVVRKRRRKSKEDDSR